MVLPRVIVRPSARVATLTSLIGGLAGILGACTSSRAFRLEAVPITAQNVVNAHVLDPDAQLVNSTFADAATGRSVRLTTGGYSQGWELSGDGLEEFVAQYEVLDTKHPEVAPVQHLGWFLGSRQKRADPVTTLQYGGIVLCAGESLKGVVRADAGALKVETSQRTITVTTTVSRDRRPAGLRVDPPAVGCAPAPTVAVASTIPAVPQAPAEPASVPVPPLQPLPTPQVPTLPVPTVAVPTLPG